MESKESRLRIERPQRGPLHIERSVAVGVKASAVTQPVASCLHVNYHLRIERPRATEGIVLSYTRHAAEIMRERKITEEHIKRVIQDGILAMDTEGTGVRRFIERREETDPPSPLVVVLDTTKAPNKVITVYRDDLRKRALRKYDANCEWLRQERAGGKMTSSSDT
jgi:hypothetical protein